MPVDGDSLRPQHDAASDGESRDPKCMSSGFYIKVCPLSIDNNQVMQVMLLSKVFACS